MMLLLYRDYITPWLLLIPVVAVVQYVLTLGMAIAASALTVFYRDIGNVAGHALRIWFYLSPALYGSEQIQSLATKHPEIYTIYNLNPFAALFESYRNLIYYGQPPTWGMLGLVLIEAIVILLVAVLVFRRLEPSFAKVL
jgi:ABC-type polysaccharide/polyol phosphate export permease